MKMKINILKKINASLLFIVIGLFVPACSSSDFEQYYTDPSKIQATTVEKQFSGFLKANLDYVVPNYWNYFVILSPTVNRYTQAVGWINSTQQYVPGGSLINDRWSMYYKFLSQYRELENVYGKLSKDDQNLRRIYIIAATIYLYDETQKVVDLHGDIPFLEAGKIGINGGDYVKSTVAYDKADAIYTKMLDDLKAFDAELSTITVSIGIKTGFAIQDYINFGDVAKWRAYCNSLRIKILMRVSGVSSFTSRVNSELQTIASSPSNFVSDNSKNIQINVFDLNTDINAKGFKDGIGSNGWNYNLAGKAMIDKLKNTKDPRLRVMFEPNVKNTDYNGLDQTLNENNQTTLVEDGEISIYNRSTYNQNQYFPGVLINAAEINLFLAEYYLNIATNDAAAKAAYNSAIEQSIRQHFAFRARSNDNQSGPVAALTPAEITAYQTNAQVSWDLATSTSEKLRLIATQKWINYNIVQPLEGWAEQRRLDLPSLTFFIDKSNPQSQPPKRWVYPSNEKVFNPTNYQAVAATDNLTTKLFWDVK